jgi:hypothetical protein
MRIQREERNRESGVEKRIILFGKKIKKISKLEMIKEKKLILFGKKNPNLPSPKLDNLKMRSI